MCSVDGHTSEGNKVLSQLRNYKTIQNIIKNLEIDTQNYLLKHSLFKVEGQIVNKRLVYPTASKIYKKSESFYENKELFSNLMNEVEILLPEIYNIRESVLNNLFKKNTYKNVKR